ncbi:Na(+)-translocating NADH-quinone reductase subunit C [Dongshaea marina]|uniref:Na(+)-translocating NADH-quinone reductase subunit C n=1 Tax=Dongshaea marina TaxID=2047966 RepID=UPI000D3E6334|nr:Na(+)-translocating NADH-quinone reductase subunit C [Dongshaea marina]
MANKKKETVLRTFVVIGTLCLVCAIVVSLSAVGLRPLQKENKALDKQINILQVAGLSVDNVAQSYQQHIVAKLVDLNTGDFVFGDASTYSQTSAAKDPKTSIKVPSAEDVAKIGRRANLAPVYLARDDQGKLKAIILPIHGQGLWSTMYALLALKPDGNTVMGLNYYQQEETPGLGAEVENPAWKAQWVGKTLFDSKGDLVLRVMKNAPKGSAHDIDALSGATLTSDGVENTFKFWMGPQGWGPFLEKVRKGEINYG